MLEVRLGWCLYSLVRVLFLINKNFYNSAFKLYHKLIIIKRKTTQSWDLSSFRDYGGKILLFPWKKILWRHCLLHTKISDNLRLSLSLKLKIFVTNIEFWCLVLSSHERYSWVLHFLFYCWLWGCSIFPFVFFKNIYI